MCLQEYIAIKLIEISPCVRLIDLEPPIPGYNRFIGSYLLSGTKIAIVDPGPSVAVPGIMEGLKAASIRPEQVDYIILTHIHIDHAGGTGTLCGLLPGARVIAHSRAVRHLADPAALWQSSLKTLGRLAMLYAAIEPVPADRIIEADESNQVYLDKNITLEVYMTPGHAPHHLSLFNRADGMLLAGEAGGVCCNGYIRPATPPPFKLEQTLASIDKLIALNPQCICYGHFGCFNKAVDLLKRARQQILDWYKIANAEKAQGKTAEHILEIIRSKDSELDYLNSLDKDTFDREYTLLLNSICGLAGIVKND